MRGGACPGDGPQHPAGEEGSNEAAQEDEAAEDREENRAKLAEFVPEALLREEVVELGVRAFDAASDHEIPLADYSLTFVAEPAGGHDPLERVGHLRIAERHARREGAAAALAHRFEGAAATIGSEELVRLRFRGMRPKGLAREHEVEAALLERAVN